MCNATNLNRRCLLWVISGHSSALTRCPLYPQKRTSELARLRFGLQRLRPRARDQGCGMRGIGGAVNPTARCCSKSYRICQIRPSAKPIAIADSDFDDHQQHQSHQYLPLEPMSLGRPSEGYRSIFHTAALVNRAGAGRQQSTHQCIYCPLSVVCLPRQPIFFALARHHLWTFPNNRVDTTNAAGWRKPVWRTGGTRKAFPPHLPRKRISGFGRQGDHRWRS